MVTDNTDDSRTHVSLSKFVGVVEYGCRSVVYKSFGNALVAHLPEQLLLRTNADVPSPETVAHREGIP